MTKRLAGLLMVVLGGLLLILALAFVNFFRSVS
jgi:hypothetical protein